MRTATLSIANDDADENPYNFSIQGTGLAPEMDVLGNGQSIIDGDTTPSLTDHTDFDRSQVVGEIQTRTFTIRNLGTGDLNFVNDPRVALIGGNAGDFSIATQPNSPVVPGGSTVFQISFDPDDSGIRSTTITISNDDADENPYTFTIQGTGIAPEIDVQGNGQSIADGDTTPSLADYTDFGEIQVSGENMTRSFTIRNSGDGDLNLTTDPKISITGTNAADFGVAQGADSPVEPGGATTFKVIFDPNGEGERTAAITISNNDPDEGSYNFSIKGRGIIENDGIPSEEEAGVPTPGGGFGDGNNDGIPDENQSDVGSLQTFDDTEYVTLDITGSGKTLEDVSALDPSTTDAPADLVFPFGMFEFEIHGTAAGETVTVILLIPRNLSVDAYYKKNRTTGKWQDIVSGIDHNSVPGKTRMVFNLTNNGVFDGNPADDVIRDPGGPVAHPYVAVPSLTEWGTIVFGLFLLGSAVLKIRRRNT